MKDKKGMEMNELIGWLIALGFLAVAVLIALLLSGKFPGILDKFRGLLRF